MSVTRSDVRIEFGNALQAARALGMKDLEMEFGSRVQGTAYAVSGAGYVGWFAIGRTRAEAVATLRGMTFAWELARAARALEEDRRRQTHLAAPSRFNIVEGAPSRVVLADPDARNVRRPYER